MRMARVELDFPEDPEKAGCEVSPWLEALSK